MAFRRRKRRSSEGTPASRVVRVTGAFVIVCLVFATGFALRGNSWFLERMGLDSYAVVTEQNPGATVSGNTFDSISARVAEVQGYLEQKSLDEYDLDKATSALVSALLKQTGDPYARYYDEEAYGKYRATSPDEVYGIGVLFGDYQNQAYAVDIIPSSSAQAAGVEVGDFVVAIDGERRETGWTMRETISRIERDEGGTVVITWRRPVSLESEGGKEFTTTLTCGAETQENVTVELRNGNVGYLKVRQLGRTTASTVESAVKSLSGQGALFFILDLRDCPGGYLSQAVEVASLFQESGVIVQIRSKGGTTNRAASGKVVTSAPLSILVNGNTAAAAEVLAAGLQDNARATVVGQQTLGKGTVQVMQGTSFGGAISYTAAEYLTPQGRSINGSGVSPDIYVENNAAEPGQDIQLNLAIESAASARAAE